MKRREDETSGHDDELSYAEEEGERIDYTEEEEEEEEEEVVTSTRRKKKTKRNRFLDIEAGEAEQEGDEEDEEADLDDYYSEDEELSEEDLPRLEDYARRPVRPTEALDEAEEDFDAEAEEARLRRLYGHKERREGQLGDGLARSAVLLPKATDPKLWLVKCRPGKERDAVAGLVKGLLELDKKGSDSVPLVFSAVSRDGLKGYIYVEAFKPADIVAAVQRLHLGYMLFASQNTKPSLVPMGEMADVLAPGKEALRAANGEFVVEPGSWARVKRGKYAGDLCRIDEVPAEGLDAGSIVRIRVLPRLSYVRTAQGSKTRPPARPFDPQEAAQHGEGSVTKSRGLWVYGQEMYTPEGGFLLKEVKLGSLQVSNVAPRPDELARFGADEDVKTETSTQVTTFAQDDRVLVIGEGEMKGLKGRVQSVGADGWLRVRMEHAEISSVLPFRPEQLQRCFEPGDAVRMLATGASAMVLETTGRRVAILLTGSQQQLTVSPHELTTSQANIPNLSVKQGGSAEIELNDLVQTEDVDPIFGLVLRIAPEEDRATILDQTGLQQSLALSRLRRIVTSSADAAAGAVRASDRVQVEPAAPGAPLLHATVLQAYRNVAFCKALDTQEILVRPFHAVHPVSMHPIQQQHQQQQASTMRFGGKRHLLGRSVTVAGGPYKGYAGIVKDVLDGQVRVELHTNSKLVSVDADRVIPVGGAAGGETERDYRGADRGVARAGPGDGKTPAWSSAKTPGWNAGQGKTPAWNPQGKTPAWNPQGKTPAWNPQGKTPAWNPQGKTPAWNPGQGKTPAWNPNQGKTPAWNPQGKTPTWNAQAESGRTPAWNASGKTPVWTAAGPASSWTASATPAWNAPSAPASSGEAPAWAQPGVLVRPRGATAPGETVESIAPGRILLANGQSYKPSDLEPIVPGKKDRVKLLAGAQPGEPTSGTVIGLDGPDAVVRLDETSAFRIVPLQNLARIA